MVTYVGCLEADLQTAAEYATGGIGPFFQKARREEPFDLLEFLSRSATALRKLGITSAITLFVDETEIYVADDDAEGDTLEAALSAARSAELDGAVGFYLLLSFYDSNLSHLFSLEASVDHPADEAAFTVLDIVTPLEDVAAEVDVDGEGAAPENAELLADDESRKLDENVDTLDRIEDFLGRVLAELDKELALTEPEIDVWIDWEGAYGGAGYGAGALPGLPGLE